MCENGYLFNKISKICAKGCGIDNCNYCAYNGECE